MGIMDFFKKGKKGKFDIKPEFDISEDASLLENENEVEDENIIDFSEIEVQDENIIDFSEIEVEDDNIIDFDETEVEDDSIIDFDEIAFQDDVYYDDVAFQDKDDIIDESEFEDDTNIKNTEVKKIGFFKKILSGLDKTRKNIISGVENVLKNFTSIDEELFEELEEVLIMADIGVDTSLIIISSVKDRVKKEKVTEVSAIKNLIVEEITKILTSENDEFVLKSPTVILVIGVNGVGKTTTIGKLASNYSLEGKKVILAAADTFRAAAIDQLEVWGKRSSVDVIKHQENSDPGAVVFDAIAAAKARKADILICDTAGRLHNKKNLMDELAKIFRIINREYENAQLEVLLVLDATTGQNALQQAKVFKEVAGITGIVLTKLDGTAKGGIIIAIKNELKIPVRFIGIGEGINDLQPFDAYQFSKALFGEE